MKSAIQNKYQCQVTQIKIKDLEQSLIELFEIRNVLHPRQFSIRKRNLEKTIKDLQQEIEEFERNK